MLIERLFDNFEFSSFYYKIKENKESYELEIAVPGLEKEDLLVEVVNQRLCISCQKENNFVRKFNKTFYLPSSVDSKNIEALCKNGILHIKIPKKYENNVIVVR